ncbi:MAG: acyltransferase family protein [Porphyromonadaceae bacterium]|nr:acyltransferase family protein [Porphyromonadaceae bacterium]
MQQNTYLPHVDILKGIAILLVLMGHIFIFGLDYARSPIFSMICSIHMPLFVMLSGMLSARPMQFSMEHIGVYWRKKSIQLLLPLVIIPFFYALTANISTEQMIFGVYHGGYWFTFSLSDAYPFFPIQVDYSHLESRRQALYIFALGEH